MLTLQQAHEWLAEFVSDFDAGKRLPPAAAPSPTSATRGSPENGGFVSKVSTKIDGRGV